MRVKVGTAVAALLGLFTLAPIPEASGHVPQPSYHLYFGDIHNHTRYSDGWEGTPEDAYRHARASGADFLATSDHNFMLTEDEWTRTKRQATRQTDGAFAALPVSEYWIAPITRVSFGWEVVGSPSDALGLA